MTLLRRRTLAEPFSDISETKYLIATSYTVDLIPEEPNNFCLRTPSAKAFDYFRFSVIFCTRSYLLRHFEVMHAYYKPVACDLPEHQQRPTKSNEMGNSNLNLPGFWWRTLYHLYKRFV